MKGRRAREREREKEAYDFITRIGWATHATNNGILSISLGLVIFVFIIGDAFIRGYCFRILVSSRYCGLKMSLLKEVDTYLKPVILIDSISLLSIIIINHYAISVDIDVQY